MDSFEYELYLRGAVAVTSVAVQIKSTLYLTSYSWTKWLRHPQFYNTGGSGGILLASKYRRPADSDVCDRQSGQRASVSLTAQISLWQGLKLMSGQGQ